MDTIKVLSWIKPLVISKKISTIDADGVALVAIQALHGQNLHQQSEINALKQEMAELRRMVKSPLIHASKD